MNKKLKYSLVGLAIFVGLVILVYTAAYIYVIANKPKIIGNVRELAASKLKGNVSIGDIDIGFLSNFPGIAVELDDLVITDTTFNVHKHPFFKADNVNISISISNLLQNLSPLSGIAIENGQLYIFTDTSGYTNSYLLSPKDSNAAASKSAGTKVEINKVKLKDVRLVLDDRLKKKLYDFDITSLSCNINTSEPVLMLTTKNNVLIHSFAFNTDLGSFVKETRLQGNIRAAFNKSTKQLSFDDVDIKLKDHPFNLSGAFSFSGKVPAFRLKVSTANIGYEFAKSLLTHKIDSALSIAKIEKPIKEAVANISGPLNGGDPLVNVTYTLEDNNIESRFANFTHCSFKGAFNNEIVKGQPRLDPNSRLAFHDFKGNWEGLDINSKNINIDNLVFPEISGDVKSNFELSQLNNILQSNTLDFTAGSGNIDITYSGPLEKNTNHNTAINGTMNFSDGVVVYRPHNIDMKDLSGKIVFKNTDVFVNELKSKVQGSKIVMNGSARNILSLINTAAEKAFIDWEVYSPSLNLDNLSSLLAPTQTTARTKTNSSKLGKTGQNLDALVNQGNFNLNVKADELIFHHFNATNVKADLGLLNQNWNLKNISLNHAGGFINLKGFLNEKNNQYYSAGIKVQMNNVDVNKVFYAFDDFGQSGIESDNLRGKLTSSADIKMDIDRSLATRPINLDGIINFSLKNGALLHYEPLQKIQTIIFKKRNFDEIYFAELKDQFDIENSVIKINRMEIQSTALTLFISGIYSLRGNSDLSIQVPLSNLKKRDDDYKPENKGADSKGGASVFIRGQPNDKGVMQFKLDIFKKFRKKDVRMQQDSVKISS